MARRAHGFTIIEAVLIVAVLGILGLVGWRFWAMTHKATAATTTSTANTGTITTTQELKQTDTDLQNLNVSDGSLSSLDQQTTY